MSDVTIKRWWINKKTKMYIAKLLSFINRNWEYFIDFNRNSSLLILTQGLLTGVFLQAIFSIIFNDSFLSFRLFFMMFFSVICLFLIWGAYAVVISKLYLKGLSRGGIFETLKYDAFTYLPFTISILIWIIFNYISININMILWFVLAGVIPVIFLKILIITVYKKPNKNITIREKAQEIKEKHVDEVNDLDVDLAYALMFDKKDRGNLRKYIVRGEVRNAVNITSLEKNSIKIKNDSSSDLLNYSVGWPNKEYFSEGNLKLYLDDGKSEKMIFNKNAENILNGWNEFQTSLSPKLSEITIRWDSSIREDVFLSISKLSSTKLKKKHKKKNIIVIIFDGIHPESIGLYRGEHDADNISRFFSSSSSSLMFTEAYVQGEWTMPNFGCIASSLYQSHHSVYDPDLYSSKMPSEYKTLAEIFQENGYNTLGYASHNRVSPGYGHARGYDKFFYRLTRDKDTYDHKDIILQTLRFLKENQESNNFVFLHVFDTHRPHFQTPDNVSNEYDALFNNNITKVCQKSKLEENGFLFLQEIYFQKYREVDNDFSILFDYVTKYEDDHTSVIFVADHGVPYFDKEMKNVVSVGQKGGREEYLVESMLKIPLILRLPKDKKPKLIIRNDIIEGNLTIMPTALEIAGIKPPEYIDGVSVFKNNDPKSGKGYAISESLYKDRYELFLKTNKFKYYLKTNRNRDTGEILKTTMYDEKIFDSKNKKITDKKKINKLKNKVKKLANENKLPDAFKDE